MGMKNLIILSLVAIGLAKYVNAFVYPGPSKARNSPSFSWNGFGGIGELGDPPQPERPRRQADIESPEKPKQFVLGSLKRVKNGDFPAPYGIQRKARRGISEIDPAVNSEASSTDQQNLLFPENTVPVLENDKASLRESSSSGQSGESAADNNSSSSEENADPAANQWESSSSGENSASSANQERPSSSEENSATAANQRESSSIEESNAPAANQEGSSSSEENAAPASNQGEPRLSENAAPSANREGSSSSEENAAPASNQGESRLSENAAPSANQEKENALSTANQGEPSSSAPGSEEEEAEVVKRFKKQDAAAKLGLQAFVGANRSNNRRPLVFTVRDVDHVGRNSPGQGDVLGPRHPREIASSFPKLSYTGGKQRPQGQILGVGPRKRGRTGKK